MPTIQELYAQLSQLGLQPKKAGPRSTADVPNPTYGPDVDVYDVLIGAPPSSSESQAAVSAALRRKRDFGELGMLTGDKVLGNYGQQATRSADSAADNIQRNRQMELDNAQTRRYQEDQISHMGDVLGENQRNNTMDFLIQSQMADAANIRANRPAGRGSGARLRAGDIKSLQDNANALGTIGGTLGFLDEGGKLGAVEMAPGMPVPLLRETLNFAAGKGIGSEKDKQTALQWQNYKRFYELAERNKLFGATLTPNEMRAWSEANPATAQTDAQIRKGLEVMQKVYTNRQRALMSGLAREGYDADAIADYAGEQSVNLLDEEDSTSGTIDRGQHASFDSVEEAEAAAAAGEIQDGDQIVVGGRKATWRD